MIDLTQQIQYPLYYKCSTKTEFKTIEQKICKLLNLLFAENGTSNYANPIVDIDGKNWLVVYENVLSVLPEGYVLKEYSEIVLPDNTKI